MIIAGKYSFNGGAEAIEQHYPQLLREIEAVIGAIDASICRTKTSKEKTMTGKLLYSPKELNKLFKAQFGARDWHNKKVECVYPTEFYTPEYTAHHPTNGAFRDMDFVKGDVGIEVQFGKYSFMVYNVCAKMTIFSKMGFIKVGVEIVPIKSLADEMSTGVSYFEQIVWDLNHRGVSDIDVPVLIIGIEA